MWLFINQKLYLSLFPFGWLKPDIVWVNGTSVVTPLRAVEKVTSERCAKHIEFHDFTCTPPRTLPKFQQKENWH
ncbi:hypothetical protein TNCV_3240261 [Trichonephila clavipes]|nr:hypothetical protein TNCV_3240261 [Trichonephila clavipes]